MKLFLTLSYGQVTIEGDFGNNNNILKTIMHAETVIAKRLIKDSMVTNQLKPHTVEGTQPIMEAFKIAYPSYTWRKRKRKLVFFKVQKRKKNYRQGVYLVCQVGRAE